MKTSEFRVLFVCAGNICRSPTAEGVVRRLLETRAFAHTVVLDSAGTHGYHVGQPPDSRAQEAARRRGVDLSMQRARRVEIDDFHAFDLILAMDSDNLEHLQGLKPANARAEVRRFLEFAAQAEFADVPDPYYGGANGFELVLDLVERAGLGLIAEIESRMR